MAINHHSCPNQGNSLSTKSTPIGIFLAKVVGRVSQMFFYIFPEKRQITKVHVVGYFLDALVAIHEQLPDAPNDAGSDEIAGTLARFLVANAGQILGRHIELLGKILHTALIVLVAGEHENKLVKQLVALSQHAIVLFGDVLPDARKQVESIALEQVHHGFFAIVELGVFDLKHGKVIIFHHELNLIGGELDDGIGLNFDKGIENRVVDKIDAMVGRNSYHKAAEVFIALNIAHNSAGPDEQGIVLLQATHFVVESQRQVASDAKHKGNEIEFKHLRQLAYRFDAIGKGYVAVKIPDASRNRQMGHIANIQFFNRASLHL